MVRAGTKYFLLIMYTGGGVCTRIWCKGSFFLWVPQTNLQKQLCEMHFGSCCDPDARWSGLLICALAQASSCHSPYKLALSKPASSLQSSGLPKVQCAASLPQEPPCLPHHRNTDSKLLCFAYAQGCTLLGSAHSPVLSLFLCFPLGSQAPARSPTAQTYPMLSDLQSLTCTLPSSQPILLAATTVQGTPTHPSILG